MRCCLKKREERNMRWPLKFRILVSSVFILWPCMTLAQQGAFPLHLSQHECTHETDQGKDYKKAGIVKLFLIDVAKDRCHGKYLLKEYICSNGHLLWGEVSCQNVVPDGVCKEGACVPASEAACQDSDDTVLVDALPQALFSNPILSMNEVTDITTLTTPGEASGMGASTYLSQMKDVCGKAATICTVPKLAYESNPELCDCEIYPGNCLDYSKVLKEAVCVDNLNTASPLPQTLVYKQFDCTSVAPYGGCLNGACVKDQDQDGTLDPQDDCPCDSGHREFQGCPSEIPQASANDADQDGACNPWDNCPDEANPDQADMDQDGLGDACDEDTDGDGIQNDEDNCPLIPNENQTDMDGDGLGNDCDDDIDGDSVPNPSDNCSHAANPNQEDSDKDKKGDACDNDGDNDGTIDDQDNCPDLYNPDQKDTNNNGFGDLCDDSDCLDMSGLQAKAPWPMTTYCPQHHNRSPYNGPGKPKLKWSLDLSQVKGFPEGAHFTRQTPVIAADGTLYLSGTIPSGSMGFFVAVHPGGSVKWFHMLLNDTFSSSAAIAQDSTIYVATDNHKLYAIQPNKNIKWIFEAPHEGYFVASSPVIAPDGTIYIGSSSDHLYAISPKGNLAWSAALKSGILTSPLLLANNNIVVGSGNKWVAITPEGKIAWSFEVETSIMGALGHHMALVHPSGAIFVGGESFSHYLLNSEGGLIKEMEVNCIFESQQVLGKNQKVYCVGISGLTTLTEEGIVETLIPTAEAPVVETMIAGRNGTLYGQRTSNDNTQIKAFTSWGTEIWTYETNSGSTAPFKTYGGSENISPVIGTDHTLYFIDGPGLLHALGD